MILVCHLSHDGVSFADSARSRKLLDSADALVCSYYVRCVSTQRFLADVSVNHSRTGAVSYWYTQGRASRLSSSGYVAGLQLSRGATGLRSSPAQRMTRPCASRTLLSSCLRGNAAHAVEPDPASDVARQAFRRSQLCTCVAALLRGISGALSTRPNVDASLAGFKEVSYYHRVTLRAE